MQRSTWPNKQQDLPLIQIQICDSEVRSAHRTSGLPIVNYVFRNMPKVTIGLYTLEWNMQFIQAAYIKFGIHYS